MEILTLNSHLETAIITQCFFSIIYLSSSAWQRNKWLVVIFLALFSVLIGFAINLNSLAFGQKLLVGNPAFFFLILPSFYFYTLALVDEAYLKRLRYVVHFLPFLVFYLIFLWIPVEAPEKFILLLSAGHYMPIHLTFLLILLGHIFYYGQAIFKLIEENQIKYQEEYAETNIYLTLDWLKYLCWLVFIIAGLCILALVSSNLFTAIYFPMSLVNGSFLLISFMVSYFSFRQPTLYTSTQKETEQAEGVRPVSTTKPNKDLLSPGEIEALSTALNQYIEKEQPFLNSKIKLPDIAQSLKVSPYRLSWLLNNHYQINFFTFINQHRIEYAIDLLQKENYQNYTLEAISQMAGFQSKTTFNTRFKELKGMTPSAYRKGMV